MSNNPGKKRLAVLVSGGGTNMQSIIDATERGDICGSVVVVISSNDEAYALKRAEKHGIPAFVCSLKGGVSRDERDEKILALLGEYRADYVILAGYLGILTDGLLEKYENRILNIHPALLPDYGGKSFFGLNVHRAVIADKRKESGATVHFVGRGGIDTGLIIAQEKLEVLPSDTPESLQQRILDNIEHKLFVRVIRDLCAGKIKVENNKVIYEQTGDIK